ncbi:MAG: DUF4114 domain-containing protein [Bacteroidaceae bacterium]|nr:DUF4114 domain-containing protein [Bacteroidaceae bacterium]
MKKILSLLAASALLAACSNNSLDGVTPPTQQEVNNSITASFESGVTITIGQTPAAKKAKRKAPAVTDFTISNNAPLLATGTARDLVDNVFMEAFPNGSSAVGKDHSGLEDFASDFLYVSNGEPFDVYVLYSQALYIDDLGIYYYDEDGNKYEHTFWSMADTGWLRYGWYKNGGCRYAYVATSTYNTAGKGYTMQLPKGWKFGFYVYNDQNGKKYSEAPLNFNEDAEYDQIVTYDYNGTTLVGFEDVFQNNGSDKDFNDVILMINPTQAVLPTGEIIVQYLDEDGNELAPTEYSGKLKAGETYTGHAKEIFGYELVDPTTEVQEKTISEYRDHVITFVYKKVDIDIQLGAIDKELTCESDDFSIKYEQEKVEYAYMDRRSGSNLKSLTLKAGKNLRVSISDINAWDTSDKQYWTDLHNGKERAHIDLRLYDIFDSNAEWPTQEDLQKLFTLNDLIVPDNYEVQLDYHYDVKKDGYNEVHISILIDRPIE